MEQQLDFNCQTSQSRSELLGQVSALLDGARALDAPLVRYHLERARAVLELPRDRDALSQYPPIGFEPFNPNPEDLREAWKGSRA
jgi:hypothetical protein